MGMMSSAGFFSFEGGKVVKIRVNGRDVSLFQVTFALFKGGTVGLSTSC